MLTCKYRHIVHFKLFPSIKSSFSRIINFRYWISLSKSSFFMMVSSRFSQSSPNLKPSNKFYQLVGSNERQGLINYCSTLSCFIIITCSILSLFLAYQNSSMFFPNNKSLTLDVVRNDRITTPSVDITVNPSVENSVENPSKDDAETRFAGNPVKNPENLSKDDAEITSAGKPVEEPSLDDAGITSAGKPVENPSKDDAETRSAGRPVEKPTKDDAETRFAGKPDECAGKYIYVLDVPSEFNSDLLDNCETLNPWTNACKLLENFGLGSRLEFPDETVFSGSNWFNTDQWSLEVIFHGRVKQYKCLTNDYSKSSAVYVPYYPGLDVGRYLWVENVTLRDETSSKLVKYISQKPEWKRFGGRDHFLVAGRMTWDFSRGTDNLSEANAWGNRLLHLPEIKNMTTLLLETRYMVKSEFAIPYPTYFHPSTGFEVYNWQEKMRQKERIYLFSFAGAPRPNDKESIRNILIAQCLAARGKNSCKYVHTNPDVKPETVMGLFQSSDFCLQPPGDSLTRKSIFDTIIAGCIPVLFHPGSAYGQYLWHLPKDYSSYSVFIPMDELSQGKVSIEKRLLRIPKEKIRAMREEVIKLIPRIVYANPNSNVDNLEDAFEVAVKGVLERVEKIKIEMEGGKISV